MTVATPIPGRPGIAADLALAAGQVRYEQRQFWRNPPSAFFAFAFPIVFLLLLSTVYRGKTEAQLGGIPADQFFVPAIMSFAVFGATFTNLANTLSIRRDSGVLKRLRAMPMPPWVYLAGVVGSAVVVALALVVVTTVVGILFFGLVWEGRWLGLILDVAAGAFCFSALGIALAGLIPNGDAAPAITNLIVLPLAFASGSFGYIDRDSALTTIARVFPLRHFGSSVFAAFDPYGSGIGANRDDLLIVLAWGIVGVAVARRSFRWAPRHES